MNLREEILQLVQKDWVSYVELCRLPGMSGGTAAMTHPEFDNIIMWTGLTAEGAATLIELQGARLIHWEPSDPMGYLIDGGRLDLPLVKRAMSYKTEHWLPVYWRPGPIPEADLIAADKARAKHGRAPVRRLAD